MLRAKSHNGVTAVTADAPASCSSLKIWLWDHAVAGVGADKKVGNGADADLFWVGESYRHKVEAVIRGKDLQLLLAELLSLAELLHGWGKAGGEALVLNDLNP